MKLTIYFTGVGKGITGQSHIEVEFPSTVTYSEIIHYLKEQYPALIGILLDPNQDLFLSSTMFSVNGEMMLMPGMEHTSPSDGDSLTIVSVITGGAGEIA